MRPLSFRPLATAAILPTLTHAFIAPASSISISKYLLQYPSRRCSRCIAMSSKARLGFGNERGLPPGETPTQGLMELLCKAGPDGVSLGDCPFTHFVQMVLRHKRLRYRLVPCAPQDKPDWLIEGYGGKMPCLVHDEEAYTDSSTIAQYLEYFFPSTPSLSVEDERVEEEVKAATGGVFSAFVKYMKNHDRAEDPKLKDALFTELGKVDKHLQKMRTSYLAGSYISLEDMAFAPKLYHVKIGVAHFKNTIIPPQLEALASYSNRVFDLDIFQASSYPPDIVTWGWAQAREASKS